MEPAELISQEWSSLSGLYTAEESDFMNQLLGNYSLPQHLDQNFNFGTESAFWPAYDSTTVTVTKSNNYSNFAAQFPSSTSDTSCINNTVTSFEYITMGLSVDDSKFGQYTTQPNEQLLANKNLQSPREHEILVSEPEENTVRMENTLKRSRSSNEVDKRDTRMF